MNYDKTFLFQLVFPIRFHSFKLWFDISHHQKVDTKRCAKVRFQELEFVIVSIIFPKLSDVLKCFVLLLAFGRSKLQIVETDWQRTFFHGLIDDFSIDPSSGTEYLNPPQCLFFSLFLLTQMLFGLFDFLLQIKLIFIKVAERFL